MAETDALSAPSHPLIASDRIEGTAVFDASGKRIGAIKRLVIEKISGQVVYAVTAFGGFMGAGSETYTIPWEQLRYDTKLHGYHTTITAGHLRQAPEFSRRDEALLSGHERQQLNDFYAEPMP
ncbi:PRC-barrel domain-containing protein [Methylobacterium durans]|uniref:Photosystem reaction center subunit H n=1 Tax=Methylobacterium durans TaxID=2202825 RepID=A0A2U8W2F9_9HYPH|nr:PRC-barrel domain-containing protein [Methylobacterium durans]AWN40269.1 photosystem reaction center subunit H [Methylobacterium durans]